MLTDRFRSKGARCLLVIASSLALWSIATSVFLLSSPSPLEVGIVLVDDCPEWPAEMAAAGLLRYERYLSPRILSERLNASGFTMNGTHYLTTDFNDPAYTCDLRERNGVDIVLMVTTKMIGDWPAGRPGLLGEANIESLSCVMTVRDHLVDSEQNRTHLTALALHETLHLLGYSHDVVNDDCVMTMNVWEPNPDSRLCPLHDFEMPYRVSLWHATLGTGRAGSQFFCTLLMALSFSPLVAAIAFSLHLGFDCLWNGNRSGALSAYAGICASFIALLLAYAMLAGVLISILICIIVESQWRLARSILDGRKKRKND